MAHATDSNSPSAATAPQTETSARDAMELFFFNLFSDNFMNRIGTVRQVLEQKYPGMLSDIVNNLHSLSSHATDMIQRQGLTFADLAREAQDIFVGEFLRQIDVFAANVEEAFTNITPAQEKKLLKAYAKPRPTDN
jgi:hypothetical protein